MAVRYTERSKPRKGGLLRNVLGLVVDVAAAAGQNVKQAATAASAGTTSAQPCNVCTAPPAAPAGGA